MDRPCKGRRRCRKLVVNSWHGYSSPGPVCVCSLPAVAALKIPSPQCLSLRNVPEEGILLTWGVGREGGRCVDGGKETALGRKAAVLRGKGSKGEALREEECSEVEAVLEGEGGRFGECLEVMPE